MFEKIFNKLFAKQYTKEAPDMFSLDYEDYLMKKYGKCDNLIGNISILVIADTHGTLNEDDFKKYLENKSYDLCIMLGDHYNKDIDIITRNVDRTKLYGIKGNHDYDYLSDYNIQNLNGKIIEVKGIKILGMEGSFKYKPANFPSFTQEESLEFFSNQGKVDILVTHDKKFDPLKLKDPAHQGLIGITDYIYRNNVPIHIHGHIHEDFENNMINGTKEYSVFGYKIININI